MHHYLEKLLNGAKVEWKTLGEVVKIQKGKQLNKKELKEEGLYPAYNGGKDYVEGHTHNGEYVLIAEDGSASLENYSIQWATGKFWANNHVHVVKGKENLNSRFLYFYLQKMNFMPYLSGGDRAKLTKAKMVEIPIPIPPLSEQQRIVDILDKFDRLTNSISEGLPKEIALRRK